MGDRIEQHRIEQHVDLDTDVEEAWRAISDRDELAAWFGGAVDVDIRPGEAGTIVDDDGVRHEVLITDVDEGRRVAWHWWDERGELSSVELTVEQVNGATRVRVVEQLVGPATSGAVTASCARRWGRASDRLWARVAAHAVAW